MTQRKYYYWLYFCVEDNWSCRREDNSTVKFISLYKSWNLVFILKIRIFIYLLSKKFIHFQKLVRKFLFFMINMFSVIIFFHKLNILQEKVVKDFNWARMSICFNLIVVPLKPRDSIWFQYQIWFNSNTFLALLNLTKTLMETKLYHHRFFSHVKMLTTQQFFFPFDFILIVYDVKEIPFSRFSIFYKDTLH